ncbi:MAG: hypothetical protein WBF33_05390 [Candidatus Nitrosopolaris sp.]
MPHLVSVLAFLKVLKEWVELHSKPMKVMHDGGKEFTSTYGTIRDIVLTNDHDNGSKPF